MNVIPSEAKATLDVRALPDEDMTAFLAQLTKVVNDPAVELKFAQRAVRPRSREAPLDAEGFKVVEAAVTKHYNAVTLPTMSTRDTRRRT